MIMPRTDPKTITENPAWLPTEIDLQNHSLKFSQINRQSISREAFLDNRMAGSVTDTAQIPISQLNAQVTSTSSPPAFIFHTAFCCSTLLARALDIPGTTISFKEPDILMQLANIYRTQPAANPEKLQSLILSLFARSHLSGEKALIKPTNTANNLVPHIAKTNARIILLYGDLKGFLISILKKGEACKAFIRKQYTIFMLDPQGVRAIPERQALGLTDLQIAALVWRHQMELFTSVLSAQTGENIKSLDFRTFLADPVETLKKANTHLNLSANCNALEAQVEGDVFQKNSKNDLAYDINTRAEDEEALMKIHGKELNMIESWAKNLTLSTQMTEKLPLPLMS